MSQGKSEHHEGSMDCGVSPGWDGGGQRLRGKAHVRGGFEGGISLGGDGKGHLGHSP